MDEDLKGSWVIMDVMALIGWLFILSGIVFAGWAMMNGKGASGIYAMAITASGVLQLGVAHIGRAALISAENSEKIRKIAEDAWREYEKK